MFNEMKGAMSDSSSLFRDQLNQSLFPTITYGINSGGKGITFVVEKELFASSFP